MLLYQGGQVHPLKIGGIALGRPTPSLREWFYLRVGDPRSSLEIA